MFHLGGEEPSQLSASAPVVPSQGTLVVASQPPTGSCQFWRLPLGFLLELTQRPMPHCHHPPPTLPSLGGWALLPVRALEERAAKDLETEDREGRWEEERVGI